MSSSGLRVARCLSLHTMDAEKTLIMNMLYGTIYSIRPAACEPDREYDDEKSSTIANDRTVSIGSNGDQSVLQCGIEGSAQLLRH